MSYKNMKARKRFMAIALSGAMMLSVTGCGSAATGDVQTLENPEIMSKSDEELSDVLENSIGLSENTDSDKDETVLETIYIENVYKELVKLNEAGLIKLYLYPERPNRIPQDNSDLIPKVIRWQKNGFDVNKFYKLYPELKDKFLQTLNE